MKLRRTLIGAALAVAATMGMTVPLAAPASAASCGEVESAYGWNDDIYKLRDGSYNMDWSNTARVAPNCSTFVYRYEQIVFVDSTVYSRSNVYGTDAYGRASFPVVRTDYVPSGTTEVGLGFRVWRRNGATLAWEVASQRGWLVQVPNKSYDTSYGLNSRSPSCPLGYNDPCFPLPF